MQLAAINSVGPPPAMHADRVVAEMLRQIVSARQSRWDKIKDVLRAQPDGHPKAQQKLVGKLKEAGGMFMPFAVLLETGKRGRYKLRAFWVDGWDASRREVIFPKDTIPGRPWLAGTIVDITSKGNFTYEEDASISMVFTHHALSRLAQRCGARGPIDLMIAVRNIWLAYLKESAERNNDFWTVDGFRLKFALTESTNAFAVLNNYDDGKGGIVVATIIGEDQ
jgi:hypothetical protein